MSRETTRLWQLRNPDKVREYNRRYMRRKRGGLKPFEPGDPIREAWAERINLQWKNPSKMLTNAFMCQLSMCRSDEARRLLIRWRMTA